MSEVGKSKLATQKVVACYNALGYSRAECELKLETTPRNAQYSHRLTEMMRREESSLNQGIEATDMFQKVDDLILTETRSIFSKIGEQNCKKWRSFLSSTEATCKRFTEDVRQLIRCSPDGVSDLHADMAGLEISNGLPVGLKPTGSTLLALERIRLEEYYNKHWLDIEGHHLTEAFKSQENKIAAEWQSHEEQVRKELSDKRAEYGVHDNTSPVRAGGSGTSSPGKWQPAEKQKSLIHTAPVLSPVRRRANSDVESGQRRKDPALMEALLRVEREHSMMLESLKQQRLAATRWMTRQQVRLMAQAVEIQKERALIAAVVERDRRILKELVTMVERGAVV